MKWKMAQGGGDDRMCRRGCEGENHCAPGPVLGSRLTAHGADSLPRLMALASSGWSQTEKDKQVSRQNTRAKSSAGKERQQCWQAG